MVDTFTAFFFEFLPTLEATYQWPKRVPKNKADAPWQFKTNGAAECIALKHHLTNLWATADPDQQTKLAHWIVKDWGGVRANTDERINEYVASIAANTIPASLQGVASYSKILSVVDCTHFAIYDARVAACLNAVQLVYNAPDRQYFPHVPSRNKTISQFDRWFSKHPAIAKEDFIHRSDAYITYCELLHTLKDRFPDYEVYHFEMTLFSLAPAMCIKAMNATGLLPTKDLFTL